MSSVTVTIEPGRETAVAAATSRQPYCRVVPLPRARQEEWDDYVGGHAEGTFFHTTAWSEAVKAAFGHEDMSLIASRENRIVGVLPMFFIASRLAGRMLVSTPYAVGGGIIADGPDVAAALFASARTLAEKRRCRVIEMRSERAAVAGLPVSDRYVGFRRELPGDSSEVLGWLPRKARAAARNGRNKYRLAVSFGEQHLPEVWRLYSMSMRRLASLNYPFSFFRSIVEHAPGHHYVTLVHWNERPVAGLVTFLFKDRVMPYFIGTAVEARRCSAVNLLYLAVMERGVEDGYRVFDFGRSRRDNTGSYDFKRFHGFEPQPLAYQSYTMPGHAPRDLTPSNPRLRFARRLWGGLPLCLTRPLGARLARHIPG